MYQIGEPVYYSVLLDMCLKPLFFLWRLRQTKHKIIRDRIDTPPMRYIVSMLNVFYMGLGIVCSDGFLRFYFGCGVNYDEWGIEVGVYGDAYFTINEGLGFYFRVYFGT